MAKYFAMQFWHTMTSSLTNENTRNGLCALTSCHFAIRACHKMIIFPYARIARYLSAASTDDTEGGRAQRSPGSMSMVPTKVRHLWPLHSHPLCIFDTWNLYQDGVYNGTKSITL